MKKGAEGVVVYDFGKSNEELQEVIWEMSVVVADLKKRVEDLEGKIEELKESVND